MKQHPHARRPRGKLPPEEHLWRMSRRAKALGFDAEEFASREPMLGILQEKKKELSSPLRFFWLLVPIFGWVKLLRDSFTRSRIKKLKESVEKEDYAKQLKKKQDKWKKYLEKARAAGLEKTERRHTARKAA